VVQPRLILRLRKSEALLSLVLTNPVQGKPSDRFAMTPTLDIRFGFPEWPALSSAKPFESRKYCVLVATESHMEVLRNWEPSVADARNAK
jgi:hypothetical protein